MRCYNHHEAEAVGVCKSCGRALCPACTAEVEKCVACRGRCETDVASLLSIRRSDLQSARVMKLGRPLAAAGMGIIGATFMTFDIKYHGMNIAPLTGGVMSAISIALIFLEYRKAKALRA